jgi:hypothetical protein
MRAEFTIGDVKIVSHGTEHAEVIVGEESATVALEVLMAAMYSLRALRDSMSDNPF